MFHRPRQQDEGKESSVIKPQTQSYQPQQQAPEKPAAPAAPAEAAAHAPEKAPAAQAARPSPAAKFEQKTETKTKSEEKTMSQDHDNHETQSRPFEKTYGGVQNPSQIMQKPRPFAGAYPGAATAASAYSPSDSYASAETRKLIIGSGITMSGEIESCDYLLVEGTVEAALKGASILEIAETGVFYGTVEIDEATIAGRFEGDLIVNGRLTVRASGSVTGTIVYKELAVEAGAVLDGKVSPLAAMAQGKKPGAGSKDIKTKSVPPRNDNSGSDEGNELPFASSANA